MHHLLATQQRTVAADQQRGIEAAGGLAQIKVGGGHDAVLPAGILKLPDDGVIGSQQLVRYVAALVLGKEAVELQLRCGQIGKDQLRIDDQVSAVKGGLPQSGQLTLQIFVLIVAHGDLAKRKLHRIPPDR